MKTTAELMARMAAMKGEPAPEYIYDECGIAHQAISRMEMSLMLRQKEWYLKLDDENPY